MAEPTSGSAPCDCAQRGLKYLPPVLDALWHQLQELQQHPRYGATLDSTAYSKEELLRYHVLIQMPRSWLKDGRERSAREAYTAIQALADEQTSGTGGTRADDCTAGTHR